MPKGFGCSRLTRKLTACSVCLCVYIHVYHRHCRNYNNNYVYHHHHHSIPSFLPRSYTGQPWSERDLFVSKYKRQGEEFEKVDSSAIRPSALRPFGPSSRR